MLFSLFIFICTFRSCIQIMDLMYYVPPSEFDWSCRRFACTSDLSPHVRHPRLCHCRLYGHSIMQTVAPMWICYGFNFLWNTEPPRLAQMSFPLVFISA